MGFEPTGPFRGKPLSRRSRYDHFGTSPKYHNTAFSGVVPETMLLERKNPPGAATNERRRRTKGCLHEGRLIKPVSFPSLDEAGRGWDHGEPADLGVGLETR